MLAPDPVPLLVPRGCKTCKEVHQVLKKPLATPPANVKRHEVAAVWPCYGGLSGLDTAA